MSRARMALCLAAGIMLFDLLINLPRLSPASLPASILAPSLDLLVVLAILMSTVRTRPGLKTGVATGVSVAVALVVGLEAFLRWGAQEAGRVFGNGLVAEGLLLGVAALAALTAVGLASFFLARLVLQGFGDPLLRSLFLLAAAGCAVIQALLGVRVFAGSAVPGIVGAIGSGFR
ncbi:MAG: hypothetical protein ABSG17_10000 [Spirochaetia bacterium]|jgi:hypothetical protein